MDDTFQIRYVPFLQKCWKPGKYGKNVVVSDINISKSLIIMAHILLLIYQLPDIVRKCFCTSDGSKDPTFQTKYVPVF